MVSPFEIQPMLRLSPWPPGTPSHKSWEASLSS